MIEKKEQNRAPKPSSRAEEPGVARPQAGHPKEFSTGKSEKQKPVATTLMKTVAAKSFDERRAKKVFTPEELEEIRKTKQKEDGKNETEEEKRTKREIQEDYRMLKRAVKKLEQDNNSKIYVYPVLTDPDKIWWRAIEFSALYYRHHIAPRLGRKSYNLKDSDHFSQCEFIAAIKDIDDFVDKMQTVIGATVEKGVEGMYIFTLPHSVPDEEIQNLRRIDRSVRERVYNGIKPKAMNPEFFGLITMAMRQIVPKIKKLDRVNFTTVGEHMMMRLEDLAAVYFCYARGSMDKDEAGRRLMLLIARIEGGILALSETRVWEGEKLAAIGDIINDIRRMVINEFGYNE